MYPIFQIQNWPFWTIHYQPSFKPKQSHQYQHYLLQQIRKLVPSFLPKLLKIRCKCHRFSSSAKSRTSKEHTSIIKTENYHYQCSTTQIQQTAQQMQCQRIFHQKAGKTSHFSPPPQTIRPPPPPLPPSIFAHTSFSIQWWGSWIF